MIAGRTQIDWFVLICIMSEAQFGSDLLGVVSKFCIYD